jgi:predicted amidohydrolase YtcJ
MMLRIPVRQRPKEKINEKPTRDLIDSGVLAANHTDAPQANLWPWWGMEASITISSRYL